MSTSASASTSTSFSSSAAAPTRLPHAERAARTDALLERLRHSTDDVERAAVREELVLVNRGVAEAVAARYRGRGLAHEDLVQVAYLGLTKAAARFDPDRGHDFLTFAVPTVRGEVTRHFRDHGWAVRPPRRVQEAQGQLARTIDRLRTELGREPVDSEVADALDLTGEEYAEVLGAYGCFTPRSLDHPVTAEGPGSLGELLPDVGQELRDAQSEVRVALAPVVRGLSERDQRILFLRFFEDRTQEEIGEEIGVSQVQVSRLLLRILEQLRQALA